MQVSVSSYVFHTFSVSIVDVIPVSGRSGGAGWGCRGQQSRFSVGRTVSHEEDCTDCFVPASFIKTLKRVARVLRGSSVSTAQPTQTGDVYLYSNRARFVHVPRWQLSYICDLFWRLEVYKKKVFFLCNSVRKHYLFVCSCSSNEIVML